MRDTIKILGVEIDNITLDEAGEITKKLIKESNKSCTLIVAPNTEFVMTAQKDKEFFDILKTAKLATPDSVGITLGAKMQGKKLKERIPGQAYFRKIIELSDKENLSVYLIGGMPGIVEKTKENLLKIYPNANIVGIHNGFFDKQEEDRMIEEINKLQPNMLFVATGHPRQEKWIYNNRHRLKVDVAAGQGGTYDYEAGRIKRAPKVIQKLGIEWLWRLAIEPSRIIRMMALPKYVLKLLIKKDKTKSHWEK